MHLVCRLLFLSSSHFPFSVPSGPFPCAYCFVAAGAASFFPFFLTLSTGMDSGPWGCSISAPERTHPAWQVGQWRRGASHALLPSSLCHGPASPVIWGSGTSRWERHTWPSAWGCPTSPRPPPASALLGNAHLPLGQLSLEAGGSEKKTNDEGWQGLKVTSILYLPCSLYMISPPAPE